MIVLLLVWEVVVATFERIWWKLHFKNQIMGVEWVPEPYLSWYQAEAITIELTVYFLRSHLGDLTSPIEFVYCLARPKSSMKTCFWVCEILPMAKFDGLTSRWRNPTSWMASIPFNIYSNGIYEKKVPNGKPYVLTYLIS